MRTFLLHRLISCILYETTPILFHFDFYLGNNCSISHIDIGIASIIGHMYYARYPMHSCIFRSIMHKQQDYFSFFLMKIIILLIDHTSSSANVLGELLCYCLFSITNSIRSETNTNYCPGAFMTRKITHNTIDMH